MFTGNLLHKNDVKQKNSQSHILLCFDKDSYSNTLINNTPDICAESYRAPACSELQVYKCCAVSKFVSRFPSVF